jgi:fructokinase
MMLSDEAKTGITFVTLDKSGERDFEFYIERSADQLLRENEIDETLFEKYSLLHVGSISLIREPARSATIKAVKAAKASGLRVSFDPNVRMGLLPSEARAKEAIIGLLPEVDILKVSSEELSFITGQSGMEEGIEALAPYKIPLIFVTLGAEGSRVFHSKTNVKVQAMKVKAVDTTGAGDAYVSGILYGLHQVEKDLPSLEQTELEEIVRFASVSGGLAASKNGAMTALPTLDEINGILKKSPS